MHQLIRRLLSNWMRNILTMLQIAAAVAVITTVLMNVLPALRTLTGAPDHPLFAIRYQGIRGDRLISARVFSAADPVDLMEHAEAIDHAAVFERDPIAVIRVGEDRYAVSQLAHVSAGFADLVQLEMVAGAFFTEGEVGKRTPSVAVISEEAAQSLFGSENPIGKTINLRPEQEGLIVNAPIAFDQATVQAVLGAPGSDLEIIGVFKSVDYLVDEGFAPGLLLPATDTLYSSLLVIPKSGRVHEAEKEVEPLLQSRLSRRSQWDLFTQQVDGPELTFAPLDDRSRLVAEYRISQGALIGVIGTAALVIAGFAVFTTTLVNATQRIRAIGLARAIGATRAHVVREATSEAALLTIVGAVLGVVLAYPMGQFVLTPFQFAVGQHGLSMTDAVVSGLLAVLLAAIVGAVAAIFPAWSTARLMPAEAWREGNVR